MSRTLTAAMETESLAATLQPVILVDIEVASSEHVRAWSGWGDLVYGGNTFTGTGTFGTISSVEETTELKASGLTLTLSGIPAALIATSLNSIRQGLPGIVYFGALNSSLGLIADPLVLFSGLVDVPTLEDGGETASISVSLESLEVDRERSRVRRYTPEDQYLIDATDRGFEYVASLQDKQVVWGRR